MKFKFSRHAEEEMLRRQVPRNIVEAVLERPDEIVDEYGDKKAYQSLVAFESGKSYLVRVIVDDAAVPKSVVTVYRTSKVEKYRRKS
jgi:hypothetical protein